MTQGRGDGSEWVTSFMVSYSDDAIHWKFITDQYANQKVSGNARLSGHYFLFNFYLGGKQVTSYQSSGRLQIVVVIFWFLTLNSGRSAFHQANIMRDNPRI